MRYVFGLLFGFLIAPALAQPYGPGPAPFNGGTVTNPINAPSYQTGSITNLKTGTDCCQPLLLGPNAGVSIVGTNSENHFLGNESGQFITTGTQDTGVGEHTLGFEITGTADTAVGSDAMRNSVGVSQGTGVGNFAHEAYFGQAGTFTGYSAGAGNSAAVFISGTATNNDVITLTFTSTQIPTGSSTAAYTVHGGDTTTVIATGLTAAIMANSTLTNANVFANSDTTGTPGNVRVLFNGTATAGTILTVTSSVSGSATEIVTITGGVDAGTSRNNGFGLFAMGGYRLSTGRQDEAFGAYTLVNCTTCSQTVAMGDQAGMQITTGVFDTLVGDQSGKGVTTGYQLSFLGQGTGLNCGACNRNTLVGYGAGGSSLNGASNILILSSGNAACDTNTSNSILVCGNGTIWSATGTGTPATSTTTIAGVLNAVGGLQSNGTAIGVPYQSYSCAVPLTTGVGASTLTCFMKAARAFTVDNITATVAGTLVTVTPSVFECGTSTTCATPTTIGSGAVTSSNTATPITVSSASVAAGDYIAVELTAGTITSVSVNVQVEMH